MCQLYASHAFFFRPVQVHNGPFRPGESICVPAITQKQPKTRYQLHSQGKVPGAHKVGSKLMFYTATRRKWVEEGGAK